MLNPELITASGFSFFKNMVNYSISGIFVKYLIDRIGLEEFKTAYAENKVNEVIENQTGSLETVINDFKMKFAF